MAFDFPNAPTVGQVFSGYVWDGEKWLSQPAKGSKKNYIVNGGMMISQENGTTAGTITGYFPVDHFSAIFSNAGTQTFQQIASFTPGGSPNRMRVTVTAADASVAASDNCFIRYFTEGLRVADLRSGSSSAKTVTIQFGVKAPAGTYCVGLQNALNNRSYAAEYVIAAGEANTDVVKSVIVSLDQTGTWASDNTACLGVYWSLMVGSTFQTPVNTWVAGNFFGTANQFNFMGTGGNTFELFDVSLTEGSIAPPFQVPDYASELALCQRYFYMLDGASYGLLGYATTAGNYGAFVRHPVPMRAAPTLLTFTNTSTNGPGLVIDSATNQGFRFYASCAAGGYQISFTGKHSARL